MKKFIHSPKTEQSRKGAFMVLAFFCLVVCSSFVAFSVDLGYLNLSKTEMQNSVDAAALAAAQEIAAAVQNAPQGTTDVNAYANAQARLQARDVAQLNGYYIDKDTDVRFGLRSYNTSTGQFEVIWDVSPANVVKVTARKDNDDLTAADGKLKLFFSGVAGDGYAKIQAEAVAFVESRDIVVVHDFSRSMNFDSYFNNEANTHLPDAAVLENMQLVWNDLNLALGTFSFAPTYLTLDDIEDGVTTAVTFKYDDVSVFTDGELRKVRLQYTNGNYQTFTNVSGTSADINGSSDIEKVWVTTTATEEEEEEAGSPETITHYGMSMTFSADRKSYYITGNEQLLYLDSYFVGGGYKYHDQNTPLPYSAWVTDTKEIDYVKVRSKYGGSWYWTTFDCSPPANGNGGGNSTTEVEQLFVDSDANVLEAFGLTNVNYPFEEGSWTGSNGFLAYCRTGKHGYSTYQELTSRGYREMYGGMAFVDYVLRFYSGYWQSNDIWKTRHYPFHAIKEGHELFCEFLGGLGFDDELGMVSYDQSHRVEMVLNESNPNIPYVNISSDPITNDYTALNNLMKYKQANHYSPSTNMGGGLKDGITLLTDHKREGARSTILLMTDGNTNTIDNGENTSLPYDWDWDNLFDYDGDGNGDYYTNNSQKTYILKKAAEAFNLGYTIHTMAVGADADTELMEAIAHLTNGHFIQVPGGTTVSQMQADVEAAFHKIASFVPPAKLMNNAN